MLDTRKADPFRVTLAEGRVVTWDKWRLRLGFNYREGLVIHGATFEGRSVMKRASLVEMAVPYGACRFPQIQSLFPGCPEYLVVHSTTFCDVHGGHEKRVHCLHHTRTVCGIQKTRD